jgi:hypothetical protein
VCPLNAHSQHRYKETIGTSPAEPGAEDCTQGWYAYTSDGAVVQVTLQAANGGDFLRGGAGSLEVRRMMGKPGSIQVGEQMLIQTANGDWNSGEDKLECRGGSL